MLNPAEPPLLMRDTVFCLVGDAEPAAIRTSVESMVAEVAAYVPGYRLTRPVQVTAIAPDDPAQVLVPPGTPPARAKVAVYLEVEGAGHHLPAYAGNLDIMTSAALRVGEVLAARLATPARVAS